MNEGEEEEDEEGEDEEGEAENEDREHGEEEEKDEEQGKDKPVEGTGISMADWFSPGDLVATNEAHGVVESWMPESRILNLTPSPHNREFRPGKRLTKSGDLAFWIEKLIEAPEVVQCPPLLRPKATTCVMTLYLPSGYDHAEHMLNVFRDSFQDMKLGGIQDV